MTMTKTNPTVLQVVQGTAEGNGKRPLSSAEAEEGLATTEKEIEAALAGGNMPAFITAQDKLRFYSTSLERAVQREAEEEASRAREKMLALRPEAEAAARAADPNVVLAPMFEAIDAAVVSIVSKAAELPAMLQTLTAATAKAAELCPKAGVPFAPTKLRRVDLDPILAQRIRAIVARELAKTDTVPGHAFLPPINFVR
jgi:hypothetical protein